MKITDYLKLNITELTDSPPDITKISDNFPIIDANAKSIGEQINSLVANKADLVNGKVPSNQLPNIEVPVQSVNGKTGAIVLTKSDIGLGSADNTADSAKAVLSATKLTTPRAINGVNFDGTQNITIADGTKAPINHASTGTSYGVGNVLNYGHIKLSDSTNGVQSVNDGFAATPLAVKAVNDKNVPKTVKLTTSGTWTVPVGVYKLNVLLAGGGAGGGAGAYETYDNQGEGGYGGSGGWTAFAFDFPVTPGQQIPYVIGSGGAGAVSGGSQWGSPGGVTSFGPLATLPVGGSSNAGNPGWQRSGNGVQVSAIDILLSSTTNISQDNLRSFFYNIGYIDLNNVVFASGGLGGRYNHTTGYMGGTAQAGNGGNCNASGGTSGANAAANSACGGGGGGGSNTYQTYGAKGGNGGSGFILLSYF